ncbi:Phospholipase/carboxylesterase [Macrolepiota fuliginosa MF-IS2]|uniref:Acyl-protein thioesterase 1 n=1 Tax=Macrolepiota fuliginosa MF-IS2 TaxID=1400762 RepID=A0A9P6C791_9AGAR|nr:Phospholipase/carboxylesterase [Macrolepiota fuliginosa MF-IS2]
MTAATATQALKYLTIPAITKQTATVVFIHGLGDTGHGWQPVADMLRKDPGLHHVKWILPHSPTRRVTANLGMDMPSWFDIYSFGFNTGEDDTGMLESRRMISQIITDEINSGTPANRIFLGGFSQGGAMSLLVGLTEERKLAGLAVLSGWLPLKDKFKAMSSQHASGTSIFWGCGSVDPLVKLSLGKDSAEFLVHSIGIPRAKNLGEPGLKFSVYEGMGHATNMQELEELKAFIKKFIPAA